MNAHLPTRLVSCDLRYLAVVPYFNPADLVILHDRRTMITVAAAPVCASEDPALGRWISQPGVYSLEAPCGTHSRVGEGRSMITRVRHHRTHPPHLLHRAVLVCQTEEPLDVLRRLYLESAFARRWLMEGKTLATRRYIKHFPTLPRDTQRLLDIQRDAAFDALQVIDRLVKHDLEGFRPLQASDDIRLPGPPKLKLPLGPEGEHDGPCRLVAEDGDLVGEEAEEIDLTIRHFPVGSHLWLRVGRIEAHVIVRERGVIEAQPGSTAYIDAENRFGRALRREIAGLIRSGTIRPIDEEIGVLEAPVACGSAAALVKRLTCGRAHYAHALRLIEAPGF